MMVKDLDPAIYHARAVQEGEILNSFLGEADNQPGIVLVLFDARKSMQDRCIQPYTNLSCGVLVHARE